MKGLLLRVVNLTGRPLTFTNGKKSVVVSSGNRASVYSTLEEIGEVDIFGVTIPILRVTEQRILDLPAPEDGILYVVSGVVSTAAGREDVVTPSRTTRDKGNGRVVSASALMIPSSMWEEVDGE